MAQPTPEVTPTNLDVPRKTVRSVIVTPPMPDHALCPFPLLGPAIIRGYARDHGHKVDLVDLTARTRFENRLPFRKPFKLDPFWQSGPAGDRLRRFLEGGSDPELETATLDLIKLGGLDGYDVVGFCVFAQWCIGVSLCMAKLIKERYGSVIVFGGPCLPRGEFLPLLEFDWVDYLVRGDGEEPFVRILEHVARGQPAPKQGSRTSLPILGVPSASDSLEGVDHRKNGTLHTSQVSVYPVETKARPRFASHDVDRFRLLSANRRSVVPYLLTRGCRYKCSFCSDYTNTKFAYQPARKVVSEVADLLEEHRTDAIYFCESNINNDIEKVKELSEMILEERMKFYWGGLGTISGLDEKTIKLMARAGCRFIFLGIESGEQSMLDRMNVNKLHDVELFKRTLQLLHENGIHTHTFYIVEFPYEKDGDFEANKRVLRETAKYVTTASCGAFQLEETAAVARRADKFGLRPHPEASGRFRFLSQGIPFDEVNGLQWAEKQRRGEAKEKEFRSLIYRHVRLRIAKRMLTQDPLYLVKKRLFAPYFTYDVYL
jgi:uncharacterized Fe-S cluster-containing radical SAM superfamily protein